MTLPENVMFADFGHDSSLFSEYLEKFNKSFRKNRFCTSKAKNVNNEGKESLIVRHQLVFLMDGTGSMAPYINATKDHIQNMVSVLRARSEEAIRNLGEEHKTEYNLIFEVACVCYRDFCDDCMFETIDFTQDVEEFKTFLSTVLANGGGDAPEDVIGAFLHSLYGLPHTPCLTWDGRGEVAKRMIVWIADAPPHGRQFYDVSYGDDHPNSMIPYWEIVFKTLSVKNISLSIVKVNTSCEKAHRTLKEMGTCFAVDTETIDISQTFATSSSSSSSRSYMDGETDAVRMLMEENIDKILERSERTECLVESSESLSRSASLFKKKSTPSSSFTSFFRNLFSSKTSSSSPSSLSSSSPSSLSSSSFSSSSSSSSRPSFSCSSASAPRSDYSSAAYTQIAESLAGRFSASSATYVKNKTGSGWESESESESGSGDKK